MKHITEHTYHTFFDSNRSESSREENSRISLSDKKEFVHTFGELDLFLDECLNTSGRSPGNRMFTESQTRCEPGTIIDDRYEISEYIKSGGMGDVYRGWHKTLNREIAIKIITHNENNDQNVYERFICEAQTMATLSHDNIINIYDAGEFEDKLYLIMEYIHGQTLDEFITSKYPLDFATVLNITMQISDALKTIHASNIIHRDIKPGNIMISQSGRPVLMDFGIVKNISLDKTIQSSHTLNGCLLGAPHYMAPEQFKAPANVTPAADIYSLGLTYYELITGNLPVKGKTMLEVHESHLTSTLSPVHSVSAGIPRKLSSIIQKMTHKLPEKRYPDANAVYHELSKIKNKHSASYGSIRFISIVTFSVAILFAMKSSLWEKNALTSRNTDIPTLVNYDGDWGSNPRTYSIIPFGNSEVEHTFFSDLITTSLYKHGYELVEREEIETIIAELKMNQTELIKPETAVKIGKLDGAHIIITGNVSAYQDIDAVTLRAFDVETSEVLGSLSIDPKHPDNAIKTLLKMINSRLVYRSVIIAVEANTVQLKHGMLHGALKLMKLRVLNDNNDTIAMLKIVEVEKDFALAKIVAHDGAISRDMRVQEVKHQ